VKDKSVLAFLLLKQCAFSSKFIFHFDNYSMMKYYFVERCLICAIQPIIKIDGHALDCNKNKGPKAVKEQLTDGKNVLSVMVQKYELQNQLSSKMQEPKPC